MREKFGVSSFPHFYMLKCSLSFQIWWSTIHLDVPKSCLDRMSWYHINWYYVVPGNTFSVYNLIVLAVPNLMEMMLNPAQVCLWKTISFNIISPSIEMLWKVKCPSLMAFYNYGLSGIISHWSLYINQISHSILKAYYIYNLSINSYLVHSLIILHIRSTSHWHSILPYNSKCYW